MPPNLTKLASYHAIISLITFSNTSFSISTHISNFIFSKTAFHSWADANNSECKRWTTLFWVMESWLHIHNFSQIYSQISSSPNTAFVSSSNFLHFSISSCLQSMRSCFFCCNALLFIRYWLYGSSSRDCSKRYRLGCLNLHRDVEFEESSRLFKLHSSVERFGDSLQSWTINYWYNCASLLASNYGDWIYIILKREIYYMLTTYQMFQNSISYIDLSFMHFFSFNFDIVL